MTNMVSDSNSRFLPVGTSCLRAPSYIYPSNVENCFPLLNKTYLIHKPFKLWVLKGSGDKSEMSVCHDHYIFRFWLQQLPSKTRCSLMCDSQYIQYLQQIVLPGESIVLIILLCVCVYTCSKGERD